MNKIFILTTLFILPVTGENKGSFLFAQRTPNASCMLLGGVSNATPVPFSVTTDIGQCSVPESPILWGMDTAWDSADNVTRGTNYITKDVMSIGRVSFQPSDLVDANGNLSAAQQAALQSRLNHIAISGVRSVILNCDHEALNKTNYYGKPQEWYNVIKATVKYIRAKGFTVLTVSPFNEPDYTPWGEGTMADFRNICKLISEDDYFKGIRISAGNTLNCDQAAVWYNYMKPYVTEGNTHQLAGSFDSYANFWQKVRTDGNYATADELHNVGEAFIGVHYGMQSGVWWGWDGAARGEYCKAAYTGKEIGYAENRNAWTAAAVYKRKNGRVDAFIGSSERQATTSTFDFVSTDKPVYFEGYGPVYNYPMTIPGGTGYQKGQTNAERMMQVTSGEDIPLDYLLGGTFAIMNVNSSMCLGFYNGAKGNALNITQMAYTSSTAATHQRWTVEPIKSTIGGDYSYFVLRNVRDNTQVMDIKDWSTSEGGEVIGYTGDLGSNEQWFAEYAGNGNWYLRSRHSGLYLEIRSSSKYKNAYLQQAEYTGNANQQWRFIPYNAKLEQTAPAMPAQPTATVQTASVKLEWTANSETDLAGYMVLRALASADVNDAASWDVIGRMITTTTFIDNTAEAGKEYVYKIKAVDKSRNQSVASTAVKVVMPSNSTSKALVAHYTFEDNNFDVTENVNDAVAEGSVTYTANGVKENVNSATLDGNTYLMLPPTVSHHAEMTVSMWAKVGEGATAWQRLFDFGNGTDQYFFLTTDNGSEMRVVMKNGGSEQILSAPKPSSGWHHFTVALSADAVTLYQDGEAVATSSSITLRPVDFKPVRNYIGRSQFSVDPLWKGSIGDVRIYNAALDAAEVKTVMNGGDPTGVQRVEKAKATTDGTLYNLAGQKVNPQTHANGIYIEHGRKVMK